MAEWLAHPKRARWHLHFTPTSSSWLNLVEGWFKLLTQRRLRRCTFNSVEQLVDPIELWVEHWNNGPKLFVWKKPADEILTKVKRGRFALTSQAKSATHADQPRPDPDRDTDRARRRGPGKRRGSHCRNRWNGL